MKGSSRSNGFLIFVIILGGICGSLVGDLLASNIKGLQFLRNVYKIGTSKPIALDLSILNLSFGLNFNIGIMSIIGIILAIILYRRY